MSQPSLSTLCAHKHPPKPKYMISSDESPPLGQWEPCTHSQTRPYLRNEPKASVGPEGAHGFFLHVFSHDITGNEANLDLSDLKYNPSKPQEADMLLEEKLNECINSLSPNQFFSWSIDAAPPGFYRDRRVPDIAIVPRQMPFSVINSIPRGSPPSPRNLPDDYAILACVEHTVAGGRKGYEHNRAHAYTKLNKLLKCPLNLCFIVLGVHGEEMTIWYGDRSGVIEVELGSNPVYILAALVGLADLPFKRDPRVELYRLRPTRAYKITLGQEIYYGLYGDEDSVLYAADGIYSRGTLVLAGIRGSALVETVTDHVTAFDAATEKDRVAIKFSYPSIPWDVSLSTHSADPTLEWQALQILTKFDVPHTPRLLAHDEHATTTRQVREAAGLTGESYRVRTILVTQPLADSTLLKETKKGSQMGLRVVVRVLKDVINAHEHAWKTARIAHCDISPGNIQILEQRGILADWEYSVSVDELHTVKAINSGTLLTMPPRLAYYMLRGDAPSNISRTPWDEMCSIFLCFIYAVLDERRLPNVPPLDTETTNATLSHRMTQLLYDTEYYCRHTLRPLYRQNMALVERIQQGHALLFLHKNWMDPPVDAGSTKWWSRMRHILNIVKQ